jgi:hypothetical protein
MLFQRINRTNPEKIFIVVYNSYSTASLTNGQAVMWDYATDHNGVSVTKPTSLNSQYGGRNIAGVAAETIAAGAYGLVQVWGYHSAVRVRTMTTTGTTPVKVLAVAAGTPLCAAYAAAFCLESFSSASTSFLVKDVGFALAAQASYTTKAIAAFIKAL